MWVEGCPIDDVGGHGSIRLGPVGGVLHRSYGQYPGDYSVIRASGLAHFLVGKNPGEWVQFIDTTQVAWHCGSNWWSVGVEFTGVNEDMLTDWQVSQGAVIVKAVSFAHGIPLTYSDGSDGWVTPPIYGWHAHNHIVPDGGGDQHTDLVTPADWARLIGDTAPLLIGDDTMRVIQDSRGIYLLTANGVVGIDTAQRATDLATMLAQPGNKPVVVPDADVDWLRAYVKGVGYAGSTSVPTRVTSTVTSTLS